MKPSCPFTFDFDGNERLVEVKAEEKPAVAFLGGKLDTDAFMVFRSELKRGLRIGIGKERLEDVYKRQVLHKVCGVEMVQRVLNACPAQCSPIVVVGHGKEQVAPFVEKSAAVVELSLIHI